MMPPPEVHVLHLGVYRAAEPLDVPLGSGHGVGVEDRGAYPLVLANARVYLRRQGDGEIRRYLRDDLLDNLLVGGVRVAVEQRDGDGLDVVGQQPLQDLGNLLAIYCGEHVAFVVHALGDLEDEIAWHEGLRLVPLEVVEVVAIAPADLEDVAEPFGRDQADLGAAAGEDKVGHQGRAVHEVGQVLGDDTGLIERLEDSLLRRVGCRRGLRRRYLAGVLVVQDKVRKGAPYVYANSLSAHARSQCDRGWAICS